MFSSKTILARILLPFLVLFIIVNLATILLNRYYIAKLIDAQTLGQIDRVSAVLSNSEFTLNPVYVGKLRKVVDGDIVVIDKAGKVIVSTLDKNDLAYFNDIAGTNQFFSSLENSDHKLVRKIIKKDHKSFFVVYRLLKISTRPEKKMLLGIISPLENPFIVKADITRWMFLVGFCGLLLIILFGYIISRSVTRPVEDLVRVTGEIAKGRFDRKTELPPVYELNLLASAINTMTEKLKGYEKQVVQSSRMAAAGKVTAALAHEIRNPLSSIKMMAQILRDRHADNPENKKIIESLLEEIKRLEKIVDDLTDIIKPGRLSMGLNYLSDIIEEVISVIKPKLDHLKIVPVIKIKSDMPAVKVDRDKIKQVIWNLLLNAMESMPQGGIIKIFTENDPLSKIIKVIIEDKGCGIDKGNYDEIFTPFFTTKPEGLGLGLSTSREIIESHGGSLTVENMENKGVRAVIFLPAEK